MATAETVPSRAGGKYFLMEEKRPGEYLPVFENERGTFIYNSKDLCMIEHVRELVEAGISSFKIEGRVKSDFYVATVVKAYRQAIDAYFADPEGYQTDPAWLEEVKKVSHRDYTTGFFFGRPGAEEQNYENSSYIRNYDIVGVVLEYDGRQAWRLWCRKTDFTAVQRLNFCARTARILHRPFPI